MPDPARSAGALRADARRILDAGQAAVAPGPLVESALEGDLGLVGRVVVVAYGKAAAGMAEAAARRLGARIRAGVVVVPRGYPCDPPPRHRVFHAGHPVPDGASVAAGRHVLGLAGTLEAGETLLVLLSGGGSALVTLPAGELSLGDVAAVSERLLAAGAPIATLNLARRHLDRVKGGRLAMAAAPHPVVGLILSDVPGDDPPVIASGPLSPDGTSAADVANTLGPLWASLPANVQRYLESARSGEGLAAPHPDDARFENVHVRIVGCGATATRAAEVEARHLGYRVERDPEPVIGAAASAGRELAAWAAKRSGGGPACRLAAGETTVEVTGGGRGGRNQHLALAAAIDLAGIAGLVVGALATDGVDGPTDAAGGLVDGMTVGRAVAAGVDPRRGLADQDSHTVLAAAGDLLVTGPTGTNVADIHLALVG